MFTGFLLNGGAQQPQIGLRLFGVAGSRQRLERSLLPSLRHKPPRSFGHAHEADPQADGRQRGQHECHAPHPGYVGEGHTEHSVDGEGHELSDHDHQAVERTDGAAQHRRRSLRQIHRNDGGDQTNHKAHRDAEQEHHRQVDGQRATDRADEEDARGGAEQSLEAELAGQGTAEYGAKGRTQGQRSGNPTLAKGVETELAGVGHEVEGPVDDGGIVAEQERAEADDEGDAPDGTARGLCTGIAGWHGNGLSCRADGMQRDVAACPHRMARARGHITWEGKESVNELTSRGGSSPPVEQESIRREAPKECTLAAIKRRACP